MNIKTMNIKFTKSEEALIKAITQKFSNRAKHKITFEKLIHKWICVVKGVKQGFYPFCIADYANDLSSRELIQKIIDSAPYTTAKKIKYLIKDIDQTYLDFTVSLTTPFQMIQHPNKIEKMLYFRKPKKMNDEFKKEFNQQIKSVLYWGNK